MIMSEETDKLFAALSKMQSELPSAKKNKKGHGYNYADLAGCQEAAKEALSNNGLAVHHHFGVYDKEDRSDTTLITYLTHSSGQYIGSEFIIEKAVLHGGAGQNPAQKMGASITYMRRYAFAAIIGLAQEDNDAADVREPKSKPKQVRKPPPPPPISPQEQQQLTGPAMVTKQQMNRLIVAYKNFNDKGRLAHASNIIGRQIASFDDLTAEEAQDILDAANRQ